MSGSTPAGSLYDVVFVGDAATDLYLTLVDDAVVVEDGPGTRRLVLPFGAKLGCEVTATVPAGGNSANAAVACARLGLRTAFLASIGDDGAGREAMAALSAEGVDVSLVRLDPGIPTNRNFVLLVGHERTILVHHERHDWHWLRPTSDQIPSWLYLSSVGRDAHEYEDQIVDWLEETPQVSLAFEPGTPQIARGAEQLARLFLRAAVVVCNREEAATLTGESPGADPVSLLDKMLALGPAQVVVTDGSAGAYGSDGTVYLAVPAFPGDGPVVDRTGAGDAFAATLVAALVAGRTLEEALARAPVNAMRAVQGIGSQAGLIDDLTLEALLAGAPSTYAVRELTPCR